MRWIDAIALIHLLDDETAWELIIGQAGVDIMLGHLGARTRAITVRAWASR